DERFVGKGPVVAADAIAGEYRVIVTQGALVSRAHLVTVKPNVDVDVAIDPSFDAAVRSGAWVGFELATAAERNEHEGGYAAHLANAVGTTSVIVIGIDEFKGRPMIVGSLVNLQTGQAIQDAMVPLDAEPDKLKGLADYLTGGPLVAPVIPWPK